MDLELFQKHFRKAEKDMKAGKYQNAINHYSDAIKIDPKSVACYKNRGLARACLGDESGAIKDYEKAKNNERI